MFFCPRHASFVMLGTGLGPALERNVHTLSVTPTSKALWHPPRPRGIACVRACVGDACGAGAAGMAWQPGDPLSAVFPRCCWCLQALAMRQVCGCCVPYAVPCRLPQPLGESSTKLAPRIALSASHLPAQLPFLCSLCMRAAYVEGRRDCAGVRAVSRRVLQLALPRCRRPPRPRCGVRGQWSEGGCGCRQRR